MRTIAACHARPSTSSRLAPSWWRFLTAIALVAALLFTPAAPVRASASDDGSTSRIGVILAVVCGVSLKAAIPAPVPWAGVALMSCMFGFLDAALSPDSP